MSELFSLDPEPASTNEDLAALRIKYLNLSNVYLNVHMRPDWSYVKGFFNGAWLSYRQFADKNFPSELQIKFSERSWELYLFSLLNESSFKVVDQKAGGPNPDFKVNLGGKNLFIEAVNAGQGDKHNRVDTISDLLAGATSGQIVTRTRSFDEANHPKVRRITNSLEVKVKNYTENHKCVVGSDDFYVIALNAGDIEGHMASSPEALVLEAVKGINPAINLPLTADGALGPAYHTTRHAISNAKKTAPIDVGLFERDEFKEISGIIYFGRDVVNALLQDINPSEVLFVHNPNVLGVKALPMDVFSHFTQITISPTEWTRHVPKT